MLAERRYKGLHYCSHHAGVMITSQLTLQADHAAITAKLMLTTWMSRFVCLTHHRMNNLAQLIGVHRHA